jgi:hypothetical protein
MCKTKLGMRRRQDPQEGEQEEVSSTKLIPGNSSNDMKSKLDELVQEIKSIKQSVGDRPVALQQNSILSTPFKEPMIRRIGIPSPDLSRPSISLSSNHPTVSTTQTPAPTFIVETAVEPSLPRALDNQPFSGEDIDYYFQKWVYPRLLCLR